MSNGTKTGGPAFAQDYEHVEVLIKMAELGEITPEQLKEASNQLAGMSLRDYFAAQSIAGINPGRLFGDECIQTCADMAYKLADAMLKARKVRS